MEKSSSDKFKIFFNSSVITVSTIIEKAIFLFINILIARYLTLEHYGEYSTALGYASFFTLFVNSGIYISVIRALNLDRSFRNEHFTNSLILRIFLFLIVYSIMVLSLNFTNYNVNTIYLVCLFGLVRFFNEFLFGLYALYEADEKFYISAIFTICFAVSLITGTYIVIKMEGNYFHLVNIRLLLVILFLAIISTFIFGKFKLIFNKEKFKYFIRQTIPFARQVVYSSIYLQTNIIILSIMKGTNYSGIFNNAFIFFITLGFIPSNFGRVLLPYLYKIPLKDTQHKLQFTFEIFTKFFAVMSFFLLIIFLLFSSDIINLFFGSKYVKSIPVLMILSFSIPALFNIANILITALDKQKKNTQIMGVAAVINLVGNFILIYFFNAKGAALSAVITQIIIFILSHNYLQKSKYINLRKVKYTYLIMVLISVLCYFINAYLLKEIFWIYSMIIIMLIFLSCTFILLFRMDDIRIIKETFGFGR